ncbi:MAG: sugar transferase, partial [Anaerolineaceae bacterium]|nr:sugar transferase [Anaerolineaceae bacterium]
MYQRTRQGWLKHLDFILIDAVVLQLSFILAYVLRHGWMNPYSAPYYRTLGIMLFITDILIAAVFNTMHNVLKRGKYEEFVQTLKQAALVLCIMSIYMFSVQEGSSFSRITIFLTAGLHIVFGYITRLIWKRVLKKSEKNRAKKRSMLLVTDESHIAEVLANVSDQDPFTYSGVVLTNRDGTGEEIRGLKVVANLRNAADYICREWVDEVFIYPGEAALFGEVNGLPADHFELGLTELNLLIDQCREMAIPVHIRMPLSSFGGKSFIEKVGGYQVLTSTINYASPIQLFIKRIMDIVGGFFGSIAALILMAIIGPKIKRESPGPILFKQERIGQNGKRFICYKLRSM